MKENKYNDPAFFNRYSQMPRSMAGLKAAGEWHVLKQMLPDFRGKTVLDLGCGFGWHCIYAKENGAKSVIGIDISSMMLEKARSLSQNLAIEYRQMAMEDLNFMPEAFDVVISSLALHYVQDFPLICKKIHRLLRKEGKFICSVEHPIFTAREAQEWVLDKAGNRLHWPVDHYQNEGIRYTHFLGHKVIKYHRTMETILNSVIKAGFLIKEVSEPKPSQDDLDTYPEMKDELRRPIFLLLSATKG